MRWLRLLKIVTVSLRFGLDQMLIDAGSKLRFAGLLRVTRLGRRFDAPRAVRLRQALEALGPIFVKFGQMLSTRRDLLPPDLADELAKLQDRVPPFPSEQAIARLEAFYGKPLAQVFRSFETQPVASASVAQVHFAVLPTGEDVAVKVLRPGIEHVIANDIALMETAATLLERVWSEGRRLKAREVVAEFSKHLGDELDLMREASNCSQLRRNFRDSPLLAVPEVYWDYCGPGAMDDKVLAIVRHFALADKPIAAICHGAQLLAGAKVLEGRLCSAYPACRAEVELAGGRYADIAIDGAVTDRNLVTAPAWPAHPAWISQFLTVLGTRIE